MPYVYERQALTELLQLYKELPYLWDTKHKFYNNKEMKEKGHSLLLEKYKKIDENASIEQVKKKIEHMRAAYRREFRKKMTAALNGDEYRPGLWYYNLLSFLHEEEENSKSVECSVTYLEDFEDEEFQNDTKPKKKWKVSSEDDDTQVTQGNSFQETENTAEYSVFVNTEAETFGKTVGLQLNSLEPQQRYIAEKLISEVIFYGRMRKLREDSCVSFSQDPLEQ